MDPYDALGFICVLILASNEAGAAVMSYSFVPAALWVAKYAVPYDLDEAWTIYVDSFDSLREAGEASFRYFNLLNLMFYLTGSAVIWIVSVTLPRLKYNEFPRIPSRSVPRLVFVVACNMGLPYFIFWICDALDWASSSSQYTKAYAAATASSYSMRRELPTNGEVVWASVQFLTTFEVLFYYSHRLLHEVPFLYSRVHKTHHEHRNPTAFCAAYAHPVEYVLGNVLPAVITGHLLRPHIVTMTVYSFLGIFVTLIEHSGISIFGAKNAWRFHSQHHLTFVNNYSFIGLMDKMHGTFDASLYKDRTEPSTQHARSRSRVGGLDD